MENDRKIDFVSLGWTRKKIKEKYADYPIEDQSQTEWLNANLMPAKELERIRKDFSHVKRRVEIRGVDTFGIVGFLSVLFDSHDKAISIRWMTTARIEKITDTHLSMIEGQLTGQFGEGFKSEKGTTDYTLWKRKGMDAELIVMYSPGRTVVDSISFAVRYAK